MEWPPQDVPAFAYKKPCCACPTCAVECISQTIEAQLVIDEVSAAHPAGGEDPCLHFHEWSVAVSVLGNVITSSGSTTNPDLVPTSIFGIFKPYLYAIPAFEYGKVYAATSGATDPLNLPATGRLYWPLALALVALRKIAWGETPDQAEVSIGIGGTVGSCYTPVTEIKDILADTAPTEGTECETYAVADTEDVSIPDYIGPVLADGLMSVRFVRARGVLTGLTVGVNYYFSIEVLKRAHGSSDPWVADGVVDYYFTAENEAEVTPFLDIGVLVDLANDYKTGACSITLTE